LIDFFRRKDLREFKVTDAFKLPQKFKLSPMIQDACYLLLLPALNPSIYLCAIALGRLIPRCLYRAVIDARVGLEDFFFLAFIAAWYQKVLMKSKDIDLAI
jgi:hypothetical protein